jgi:hypothetical protein
MLLHNSHYLGIGYLAYDAGLDFRRNRRHGSVRPRRTFAEVMETNLGSTGRRAVGCRAQGVTVAKDCG